jgi:hypothetical protein
MSSPIGFQEFREDDYRKFIGTLSDEELIKAGKRLRILCGDVITPTRARSIDNSQFVAKNIGADIRNDRDRIRAGVLMRITFLLLFFLTLSLCPATLHGQSATQTTTQEPTQFAKNPLMRLLNNGAWWNALSQDAKSDFVDGFVTAMADVHNVLIGFVKTNNKELTPGPKFDTQMSAIIQLSVIAERYEYEEVGRRKLLAGWMSSIRSR